MKILVLIDKFKGTISSNKLGSVAKNILTNKNRIVDYFPISDGGDGFLDTINFTERLNKKYCYAHNALGIVKKVPYYTSGHDVYIEVAKIVGFEKNIIFDIYNATSYGVGEVIVDAIKKGGKNFYIGLGGTICNDCGKGMLKALGFDFENNIINNSLIDFSNMRFNIISDVTNPLLGKKGATYTFAKQKGATEKDFPILEKRNRDFSKLVSKYLNFDYTKCKGAGAAGGLGFAFLSALKATYHSGIDFTLNYLNIHSIVNDYDLIITGEGKIDNQSLNGKVAMKILNSFNKPTILVCGINELTNINNIPNLNGIYSIVPLFASKKMSLKKPLYYYKRLIIYIGNCINNK